MSDYTEHLISMAGGDGEPDLDQIQARRGNDKCAAHTDCYTSDIAALLAVVRSQQAKIERVREAQDDAWKRGYEACYAGEQKHSPYRAALTATEGKA